MSDSDLTDREAARLRDLLHRAAGAIDVTTPELDDPRLQVPAPDPHRGASRWLVAAAVLAVAAVGAAWWLGTSGGERIDTGPAEPPVTVAPHVVEGEGMWRLPEQLEGYRAVSAMVSGGVRPMLLAVDDADEPTRWLALTEHGGRIPLDDRTRVIELPDDMELVVRSLDVADDVIRFGLRVGPSDAYLTGTFRGIDDDVVVELLSEGIGDARTLMDPARRAAALDGLELPEGLHATWQAGATVLDAREAMEVTLIGADGSEVVVVMEPTGVPPAVAALQRRLVTLELAESSGSVGPSSDRELEEREDLGPNVIAMRSELGDRAPGDAGTLVVITSDGTMISAVMAVRADELMTSEPLDEATQLRIINSLRAMSESEFRSAIEAAGAELLEPGSTADLDDGRGG